jgi:hypothetical protein
MLVLNPSVHQVVEGTEVGQWVRREFPGVPLFLFYNASAGVWEIGEWVAGRGCHERLIIGPTLGCFDREKAAELRWVMHDTGEIARSSIEAVKRRATREWNTVRTAHKEFEDFLRWQTRTGPASRDDLLRSRCGRSVTT